MEWNTVLMTHLFNKVEDLQWVIKYHKETLIKTGRPIQPQEGFWMWFFQNCNEEQAPPKQCFSQDTRVQVYTNLVGWSPNLGSPLFPKDDSIVLKGKTSEAKGTWPCHYCDSGKCWDNNCRHAQKEVKQVRTNFASMTTEDLQAQDDYEQLYYKTSNEDKSCKGGLEDKMGFQIPPRIVCTVTKELTLEEATGRLSIKDPSQLSNVFCDN